MSSPCGMVSVDLWEKSEVLKAARREVILRGRVRDESRFGREELTESMAELWDSDGVGNVPSLSLLLGSDYDFCFT